MRIEVGDRNAALITDGVYVNGCKDMHVRMIDTEKLEFETYDLEAMIPGETFKIIKASYIGVDFTRGRIDIKCAEMQ